MERLLRKADVERESDPEKRAVLDVALKAQAQWQEARPAHVEWLRKKGLLRMTLASCVERSANQVEAWERAGVDPLEAQREATTSLLWLPSEEDRPVLDEAQAPYGQSPVRATSGSIPATMAA